MNCKNCVFNEWHEMPEGLACKADMSSEYADSTETCEHYTQDHIDPDATEAVIDGQLVCLHRHEWLDLTEDYWRCADCGMMLRPAFPDME